MGELAVKEQEEPKAIDIRSFWRTKVKEAVYAVPDEMLRMSEVELIEMIRPTTVDWQLRHRFHELVEDAVTRGREQIYACDLYGGICSERNFSGYVLENPARVAWMMRPIGDEKLAAQEAYHYAMSKIKDFLIRVQVTSDNLGEVTKAAKFMADRGYGAVAQKIEQKTLHAHVRADVNNQGQLVSKDDLREQIEQLETDIPPDIDIEAS